MFLQQRTISFFFALLPDMKLQNEHIRIEVSTHGGELISLQNATSGEELLWCGDKTFWGRHAPILFPIVGKVANGHYRVEGQDFALGQHGFARDNDFSVIESNESHILLVLRSNNETLKHFPWAFELTAEYRLEASKARILWKVQNNDSTLMYFQIGAHPAFYLRDYSPSDPVHGYVIFHNELLELNNHTFDNDALIIEDSSIAQMTLTDKDKRPYLRVTSPQSEVWGIWAPSKEGCPFVCLEPWCGRKDKDDFCDDVSQREYIHTLAPGEVFTFEYDIELLKH